MNTFSMKLKRDCEVNELGLIMKCPPIYQNAINQVMDQSTSMLLHTTDILATSHSFLHSVGSNKNSTYMSRIFLS